MPTTTEDVIRDEEKKNRKKDEPATENPGELEPVSIDDLNARTERARRKGESGE